MELPKDFDAPPIVAVKKPTYSKRVAPKGPGRKLGSKNKIPANVKAAVVEGLAAHGSDGQGRGGLAGFVYYLAARYPKQACKLIERLMPAAVVAGADNGGLAQIGTVNIVSIESGKFLSKEDCVKFSTPLALRQIDAEAIASHDAEPEIIERDFVEPEPAPIESAPAPIEPEPEYNRMRRRAFETGAAVRRPPSRRPPRKPSWSQE